MLRGSSRWGWTLREAKHVRFPVSGTNNIRGPDVLPVLIELALIRRANKGITGRLCGKTASLSRYLLPLLPKTSLTLTAYYQII
jgi:hypothetical protein